MAIGIYRILNTVTGKSYVGQSVNLDGRFWNHISSLRSERHPNQHLQSSFTKHGESSFVFEIICVCEVSALTHLEQFWIDSLDSYVNGYNQRPAADSMAGFKHSEDTIQRSSEYWTKVYESPEMKEMARQRAITRFKDPQQIEILRQSGLKRFQDPAQVEANRQGQLRRFRDDPSEYEAASRRAKKRFENPVEIELARQRMKRWQETETPKAKASRIEKCRETKARKKRFIQRVLF